MPSTAKRVVIYRFAYPPMEALANPEAYLLDAGVEVISPGGTLQRLAYPEVKCVCFASQAGQSDLFQARNLFERRPKLAGLWVRFTLRDADQLEGILSHNLLDWPATGFLLVPPHAGAMRQRVFIPKCAATATEVRGVVGAPVAVPPKARKTGEEEAQLRMFDR